MFNTSAQSHGGHYFGDGIGGSASAPALPEIHSNKEVPIIVVLPKTTRG